VLQRERQGVERLSRRSLVRALRVQVEGCYHGLIDDTNVKGDGSLSIGARGVPDSGAALECTEPPVSTLLLSAVHQSGSTHPHRECRHA
jgi:hypothetical protein